MAYMAFLACMNYLPQKKQKNTHTHKRMNMGNLFLKKNSQKYMVLWDTEQRLEANNFGVRWHFEPNNWNIWMDGRGEMWEIEKKNERERKIMNETERERE